MIGMSRTTGRSVTDAASHFTHLHQSINDILTTLIGTRICRRDYGSVVPNIIDQPCHEGTQVSLFSGVATALIRFEPRIKVSQIKLVDYSQELNEGRWDIEIAGTTTFNEQTLDFVDRFSLGAVA